MIKCAPDFMDCLESNASAYALAKSMRAQVQIIPRTEKIITFFHPTPGVLYSAYISVLPKLQKQSPKFYLQSSIAADVSCAYDIFVSTVQMKAATPFKTGELSHETQLEAIWDLATNGKERVGGRMTDEWELLGFQGKNPATDFRSTGILGLEMMLSFASMNPDEAKAIIALSAGNDEMEYGFFSFALVAINATAALLSSLRAPNFKKFMLNAACSSPAVQDYVSSREYVYNSDLSFLLRMIGSETEEMALEAQKIEMERQKKEKDRETALKKLKELKAKREKELKEQKAADLKNAEELKEEKSENKGKESASNINESADMSKETETESVTRKRKSVNANVEKTKSKNKSNEMQRKTKTKQAKTQIKAKEEDDKEKQREEEEEDEDEDEESQTTETDDEEGKVKYKTINKEVDEQKAKEEQAERREQVLKAISELEAEIAAKEAEIKKKNKKKGASQKQNDFIVVSSSSSEAFSFESISNHLPFLSPATLFSRPYSALAESSASSSSSSQTSLTSSPSPSSSSTSSSGKHFNTPFDLPRILPSLPVPALPSTAFTHPQNPRRFLQPVDYNARFFTSLSAIIRDFELSFLRIWKYLVLSIITEWINKKCIDPMQFGLFMNEFVSNKLPSFLNATMQNIENPSPSETSTNSSFSNSSSSSSSSSSVGTPANLPPPPMNMFSPYADALLSTIDNLSANVIALARRSAAIEQRQILEEETKQK
eukprot:MONOS_15563.1-p1 / transcript=MONOS_15563.1 / gene=MONOS_15563 / organism=Monocercomonoides_exilis_PA203 / gene_product=unspecified product / transcript_product=unspecified product / location=Mono_scaffold01272:9987-12572(+) / protein_length=718 / sequence_SO=supercontig / SO=protein_coding / is_pseudo=false